MSDLQKHIGLVIRQARTKAGLTQVQLSEKIGITQAMLSAYESGKENLTATQIQRIFNAMDMDVEFMGKSREKAIAEINRVSRENDLPA